MDRDGILAEIGRILSKFEEIDASYVFGSFLKADSFNDIDVALLVSNDLTPYEKLKFELKVAGELERKIKPRVQFDVKILNYSPVYFQYEVVKNGVVAYVKDQNQRPHPKGWGMRHAACPVFRIQKSSSLRCPDMSGLCS